MHITKSRIISVHSSSIGNDEKYSSSSILVQSFSINAVKLKTLKINNVGSNFRSIITRFPSFSELIFCPKFTPVNLGGDRSYQVFE